MKNKRLLEIAERQANKGIPKPREKSISLTQILERDENGKPIIELTSMGKTRVNTSAQKDYWNLMRVYECGGWRWHRSGGLPTQEDNWDVFQKETCVSVGDQFGWSSKKNYLDKDYNLISPQEFYNEQKITPEMLKEINNWFDEND